MGFIEKKKWRVLLADLHIHSTPKWRFDWLENFLLNEICTRYMKDADGSYLDLPVQIVLLGDVFEIRDRVDTRTANLFFRFLSTWMDKDKNSIIWLTGQHDTHIPGEATLGEIKGFFSQDEPAFCCC